ncbi:hypothetical protein PVAND_000103 [Polypedilum vanderplanki]|uniref:Uncharacterized protein n=1 Tax=Polypedilum vanderplanki TaxID=319348 RepID=A0A9J6BJB1_POLVA|nr:hypothetical protein PVAND_000103 [Polypedilum vanderplanki]
MTRKSDSSFNTFINSTFEFCSSLNNMPGILSTFILPAIQKHTSNFIHECPYKLEKDLGVEDFLMDSSLLSLVSFGKALLGEYCIALLANKLACINNNESKYVNNVRCELKTTSRDSSSLTVLADVVKEINYVLAQFIVARKAHSTFNTFINSTFEFCSSYKNLPGFVTAFLLPAIQRHGSSFIHECPYKLEKDLGVDEFLLDSSLINYLSVGKAFVGDYCVDTVYKEKNNESIFWLKLCFTITKKRLQRKRPTMKKNSTKVSE